MDDTSELLTIGQAALFLNVSETSLRRWTNDGQLSCVRVGKKRIRRFRRKDLVAFLDIQSVTQRTSASHTDGKHTLIGGLPVMHGRHFCSFYTCNQGRAKLALDFLADGLEQDCACYLIFSQDASREILDKLSPGFQKHIDSGRLVLSEYLGSAPAQIKQLEASFTESLRKGAKTIRLVGNVSEGRMALTNSFDHLLDYERQYDRLLAERFPLVTLCQYDARRHTGTEIMDILKCHRDVFSYPSERLLY